MSDLVLAVITFGCTLSGFLSGILLGKWLKRRELAEGFDAALRSRKLLIYVRKDVSAPPYEREWEEAQSARAVLH